MEISFLLPGVIEFVFLPSNGQPKSHAWRRSGPACGKHQFLRGNPAPQAEHVACAEIMHRGILASGHFFFLGRLPEAIHLSARTSVCQAEVAEVGKTCQIAVG